MRAGRATGAGPAGVGCLALAFALAACNPFAAFAECDNESPALTSEEAAKVEAHASVAARVHQGSVVWSETDDHTSVVVTTERSAEPAARLTDCDGTSDGYSVRFETRIASEDGLIRGGPFDFSLELDRQAQLTSLQEQRFTVRLDFDQLKAAGQTPDRWISGFTPSLTLILVPPEMNPEDAAIVVDEPISSTSSRQVTIGNLTFP